MTFRAMVFPLKLYNSAKPEDFGELLDSISTCFSEIKKIDDCKHVEDQQWED